MSEPTETLVLRGLTYEQANEILRAAERIATGAIMWSDGKAYPFDMESVWERIDGNASTTVGANAREPTDEELRQFLADEQFLLFCDADEGIQIIRAAFHKYRG